METFNTINCSERCKPCLSGKSINIEKKNVVFLFDDFSDSEFIHILYENIDDIIAKKDIQELHLSFFKHNLNTQYDHLYEKCGEVNLLRMINQCSPKIIFAFGQRSFQFLTNMKSNYNKSKILYLDNPKIKGIYLYALPNFKNSILEFGLKTQKYNPMILETRYNLQIVLSIIEKITKKNDKIKEL